MNNLPPLTSTPGSEANIDNSATGATTADDVPENYTDYDCAKGVSLPLSDKS
ncbi:hypothetical protein Vi05172_g1052 [Venturia inaequalis]|nr:hypothetical protein Vi05172_g1052 [Venturia inaequalis]